MLRYLKKENSWIGIGVLLFIIVNTVLIYKEIYLGSLIPLGLLLVFLTFVSMDTLLLLIVFLVPLSLPLSEIIGGLPIDMNLPTEPLLAGLLLIFVFKLFMEKSFDKKIVYHPISIGIYFYLIWILITSISSTMPIVSFKFLLSKLWFIVAFYFLATQLFRKIENTRKYIILYTISLAIVVFYATYRHLTYGIFDEKIAHWSANPFYKDHTSYGAMLAFYIPSVMGLAFTKRFSNARRLLYLGLLTILTIGLIFSYSRAAWLSIIASFGVWVIIKLRIKFWVILTSVGILAIFLILFGQTIQRNLEKNHQDSSTTSLSEQIKSVSNVSTDASNVERINRWNCAIRMFKAKPIFGWGPGTYMFQYAPFQRASEKTIISTNQGTGGNAHSEYLGPLSEQGFLGPIFYLILIILTLKTAVKVIRRSTDIYLKTISIGTMLGLITYYIHGILNNFLDTDKASVPFWGFMAIIVAVDVYHKSYNPESTPKAKQMS